MAFVVLRYETKVTLVDSKGKRTTRSFQMNSANIQTAETQALSIIQRLGIISKCAIESYYVGKVFTNNTFSLPVGADVENQLTISAPIFGNAKKRADISIPAPDASNFQSPTGLSYNKPKFDATYLDLFLTMFTTGQQCLIGDGENIVKTDLKGRRIHKSTNKS